MRKPYKLLAAALVAAIGMPCFADIADCADTLHRLDLAVATLPPKNPAELKQALDLRHAGEQLCLSGDAQVGLDKLEQALALFPAEALPPAPVQPQ